MINKEIDRQLSLSLSLFLSPPSLPPLPPLSTGRKQYSEDHIKQLDYHVNMYSYGETTVTLISHNYNIFIHARYVFVHM